MISPSLPPCWEEGRLQVLPSFENPGLSTWPGGILILWCALSSRILEAGSACRSGKALDLEF